MRFGYTSRECYALGETYAKVGNASDDSPTVIKTSKAEAMNSHAARRHRPAIAIAAREGSL